MRSRFIRLRPVVRFVLSGMVEAPAMEYGKYRKEIAACYNVAEPETILKNNAYIGWIVLE